MGADTVFDSGNSTLGVVSGERKLKGVKMFIVIFLLVPIVLMVISLGRNVYHTLSNQKIGKTPKEAKEAPEKVSIRDIFKYLLYRRFIDITDIFFKWKEPYTPLSNKAYYELFKCNTIQDPANNRCVLASANDMQLLQEALKKAWECRNFEIDKFWSRSLFFWGFIAAVLTGYIALIVKGNAEDSAGIGYLDFYLICLGFLFSLAWFLVLRGSKAWQENWETHIDRLEDLVNGPLYKTVFCPIRPHFHSLAKINEVMAFIVIVLWTGLIVQYAAANEITLINPISGLKQIDWSLSIASCATVVFSIILVYGYPSGSYRLPIAAIQDQEVKDSKGAFISRY
jgi:hypothetical protein